MLKYDPRTWVDEATVDMGDFNAEIRDPFRELQAGWDAYTPAWSSTGTQPSIGAGLLEGRFKRVGRDIKFRIGLLAGGDTTFGTGTYFFTLPFTPLFNNTGEALGTAQARDASGPAQEPFTVYYASTIGDRIAMNQPGGVLLGASTPWVWAATDRLTINGFYELP